MADLLPKEANINIEAGEAFVDCGERSARVGDELADHLDEEPSVVLHKEHCAKFEKKHALGTRARLAYELLSCTGLRRSDIVRVGRQHIRRLDYPITVSPLTITHEIALGQQKTDEEVGGLFDPAAATGGNRRPPR